MEDLPLIHGELVQSIEFNSQLIPTNEALQLQMYPLLTFLEG